jgi:hypothetical protein
MRTALVSAVALACTFLLSTTVAQESQRWTHPTQAFSLDPVAGGFRQTSAQGAIIIFEIENSPFRGGCTVVARAMPTMRTQSQLNASTESYRPNDPVIRDISTATVDGVTVVSFTRAPRDEARLRHVRLFAVAAEGSAVYGELGCDGATPLAAEHEQLLLEFLSSLRFSSTTTN